jgi:hypothetical protein
MNRYAVYWDGIWLFDVHADDEAQALRLGQEREARATRVELVAVAR